MPAPKYDTATIERAVDMREAGRTSGQIARALGMSIGAINYHCLRLGADTPAELQRSLTANGPEKTRRGNHTVRRFTEDEDRRMIALEAEGLSISEIARRLGRKHNSIIGRLQTLARRDARREVA